MRKPPSGDIALPHPRLRPEKEPHGRTHDAERKIARREQSAPGELPPGWHKYVGPEPEPLHLPGRAAEPKPGLVILKGGEFRAATLSGLVKSVEYELVSIRDHVAHPAQGGGILRQVPSATDMGRNEQTDGDLFELEKPQGLCGGGTGLFEETGDGDE